MNNVSRHLPIVMLTAILLSAVSCGTDEPRGRDHGTNGDGTPIPHDTIHHNDTTPTDTTHHGDNPADTTHQGNDNDTTATFTITLTAPQDYGYMGQTMQLSALTSRPATVTWHTSRAAIATVDGSGKVTFSNTDSDGTAVITATANGVSSQVTLTNRCWKVAAWDGTAWCAPAYLNVHPGDTIPFTIVDSQAHAINDLGFNAAACQWTVSSRNADVNDVVKVIATPTATNHWQYRLAVSPDAPAGPIIMVMAQLGEAASVLTCVINR